MKDKIKIVRRIGLPETNSSSSHAVSISMEKNNIVRPGDKEWDVEIEDGVLKIPGGRDFGWEYFKTNTLLTKLQYLCGIYCSEINTDSGKKRISKLKKILKELFRVKDVEFKWITEYSERLKEVEDPEDAYYSYPEIDHNSHDIFEEIIENKDTIQQFLFSRDSWLYGGNDNSEAPDGFYNDPTKDKRVSAILSIEFGGIFGRIDWEIIEFPSPSFRTRSIYNQIRFKDHFDIIANICYDIETKEFVSFTEDIIKDPKNYRKKYYSLFDNFGIVNLNGRHGILYTGDKFQDLVSKIQKELSQEDKYNYPKILEEALKDLKENEDFIFLPIKLKLLDYNYEI